MSAEDIKSETTASLEAEIRYLAQLPDDQIDTSDIPETTDEQWATARRGAVFRPLKSPVTIRLDTDVIAWFKQNSGDGRYQTAINQALREFIAKAPGKSA